MERSARLTPHPPASRQAPRAGSCPATGIWGAGAGAGGTQVEGKHPDGLQIRAAPAGMRQRWSHGRTDPARDAAPPVCAAHGGGHTRSGCSTGNPGGIAGLCLGVTSRPRPKLGSLPRHLMHGGVNGGCPSHPPQAGKQTAPSAPALPLPLKAGVNLPRYHPRGLAGATPLPGKPRHGTA